MNGSSGSRKVDDQTRLPSGDKRERPGRGIEVEAGLGRVVELAQRLEQLVALKTKRAHPQEVGIGLLHARGDGAEVAVARFVLEIERYLDAALLGLGAHALGHELRRGELAGDDHHALGRRRQARHRIEDDVGIGLVRLRAERRRRERHVVGLQLGDAHAALDHHLAVALGHAHRRQDRRGGVGPHDQVDLVDGDQLLVEAARHVGLGLVVEQDVFDGPAQEAVPAVDVLDHDLGGDLVDHRGLREEAGQRQRAADLHRRA